MFVVVIVMIRNYSLVLIRNNGMRISIILMIRVGLKLMNRCITSTLVASSFSHNRSRSLFKCLAISQLI